MRKRYIAFMVILFIVVVSVLIALLHHPRVKQIAIYKASASAKNIQFPYLADPKTIDFFTGTGFATYNTSDNTTSNISPQFTLPTVSKVRWSKTGVLFEASGYTVADDLYQVLINKYLPVNQNYWWLFNFNTQQLSLITPANTSNTVTDAFWNSNGNGYCYLSNDNHLYTSNSPNKAVYKAGGASKILQFNGATAIIQDDTGLKQVSINTRAVKGLVKAHIEKAYVSADTKTIAYNAYTDLEKKATDTPASLFEFNPESGKSRKLLSNFEGVMGGNEGNLYVGYADQAGVTHFEYYPVKGRPLSYSLGSILDRDSSVGNILPINDSTIYLDSTKNTLVRASTKYANALNPIDNSYLIDTDLYFSGFEIHFFPDQNNYEIDITQNPYLQYQSSALTYIRSKNIDPNQIVINWRANDGVTKTNPNVVGDDPNSLTASPIEYEQPPRP